MLALALALAVSTPWGDGKSHGDDLVITLVTFGPGDDMTEWFGHSALVVEDTRLHQSRLYNYGEFAFDSTVIPRYVLGHLTFHVGERPVAQTYQIYEARDRDVHLQELALTPDQRMFVAEFLANNVLPAHSAYDYDHYLDNCATRPRDVIDAATNGALSSRKKPARMTLRGHTRRMTAVSPFFEVAIDFIENASVDRAITTWDEAFLPAELEAQVRAAGLVSSEYDLYVAKRAPIPSEAPRWWPLLLVAGIVVGSAALLVRRHPRALAAHSLLVSVVLGVPGTVSFAMWLITVHKVAHADENLFTANPVTLYAALPSLIALVVGADRRARAHEQLRALWLFLAVVALGGAAFALTPWFTQDVWQWNALALPVVVATALAHRLRGAAPR